MKGEGGSTVAMTAGVYFDQNNNIFSELSRWVNKDDGHLVRDLNGSGRVAAQRRALTQPLADFEQRYDRHEAMARAYLSGRYTMAAIAHHFGVHYATVSRAVNAFKNAPET